MFLKKHDVFIVKHVKHDVSTKVRRFYRYLQPKVEIDHAHPFSASMVVYGRFT